MQSSLEIFDQTQYSQPNDVDIYNKENTDPYTNLVTPKRRKKRGLSNSVNLVSE